MKKSKLKAPEIEILLVDDNLINLNIVEEILKSYEIKVSTALSGFECLALLQNNKEKYDIIFMDQMMPGMDGIQTLYRIRQFSDEYYKSVPVIALTANDIGGQNEEFVNLGFSAYMAKPLDINQLNKCLCDFIPTEKVIIVQEDAFEDVICSIQIDGVDTELGLKYSNGNIECYKSVLRTACREADEQIRLIQDCKNKEDWKTYSILLHGLKGVAASIGANEFAKMAKNHEVAAKDKNIDFICNDYYDFMDKYNRLFANIQREIAQKVECNTGVKGIHRDLTKEEIHEIIKLIENFERDEAIRKLNSIREFILTENQNKAIDTAIELIEDVFYEEANEILLSLMHK